MQNVFTNILNVLSTINNRYTIFLFVSCVRSLIGKGPVIYIVDYSKYYKHLEVPRIIQGHHKIIRFSLFKFNNSSTSRIRKMF